MKAAAAVKAATTKKPQIRIAVVESDPLRFVGFRALFDSEPDFELVSASLSDISVMQDIDLVLLGNRNGQNLFDVMASLKASRTIGCFNSSIVITRSSTEYFTISSSTKVWCTVM